MRLLGTPPTAAIRAPLPRASTLGGAGGRVSAGGGGEREGLSESGFYAKAIPSVVQRLDLKGLRTLYLACPFLAEKKEGAGAEWSEDAGAAYVFEGFREAEEAAAALGEHSHAVLRPGARMETLAMNFEEKTHRRLHAGYED